MSNDRQETIADIVAEMRLGVKDWKGERLGVFDCFADRIEAAAKREREAGAAEAQICGEVGEMIGRAAACRQTVTDCHVLGNAGGNPRMKALCECAHNIMHNAAAKREREAGAAAAHQLEVAELRECLKEAIREKCPFLRMRCKHGEPCDYECGTFKWRKALKGASND